MLKKNFNNLKSSHSDKPHWIFILFYREAICILYAMEKCFKKNRNTNQDWVCVPLNIIIINVLVYFYYRSVNIDYLVPKARNLSENLLVFVELHSAVDLCGQEKIQVVTTAVSGCKYMPVWLQFVVRLEISRPQCIIGNNSWVFAV